MKVLQEHRVLTLGDSATSALARFLADLGAQLVPCTVERVAQEARGASFLLDRRIGPRGTCGSYSAAELEAQCPRLIQVLITPFGAEGARANWTGGELVASAMGGALLLTGDADRAPVKEALDACLFHADMVAAAAVLAAHFERADSGLGQRIDISVQEVTFSRAVNAILVWQFDRRKLGRLGGTLAYGSATVRCIWRLADGWCFHTLMSGRLGAPANQALSDWMDASGMENPLRGVDWPRYNRSLIEPAERARWEAAIDAFFRTCTRTQIAGEGRRRGINATVICEPADALGDEHLRVREFWTTREDRQVPGRFFRSVDGAAAARPARRIGTRPGPLAGIRVLDFSWALVGSITTKTLGDLGAEVVKVESRTRPCLSRIDRQVAVSRTDSFDDKPWFAHLNTSKRSLALDLKKPESREVIEPLVRWADIVVENFSPGTLTKLGLDYAALARLNPAIILVSGSVYGQTGPLAAEWGVDGTGAALSGRTFLTGWPDRDPVIPAALPYGDVIVPYVMAAAAVAALQQRRETGRGAHIDTAMYEVCLQQMYAALWQSQGGEHPQRRGNDAADRFHQGVYPARGADRWIAISCVERAQWEQLCALAGLTPDEPARLAGEMAAWSATHEAGALSAQLQAAGIEAGAVQDIEDLMEHDPLLAARGPLIALAHPLLGAFGHLRTPMGFSRSRVEPFRAPALGEHSSAIAIELAGLTPARVAELEAHGVFT